MIRSSVDRPGVKPLCCGRCFAKIVLFIRLLLLQINIVGTGSGSICIGFTLSLPVGFLSKHSSVSVKCWLPRESTTESTVRPGGEVASCHCQGLVRTPVRLCRSHYTSFSPRNLYKRTLLNIEVISRRPRNSFFSLVANFCYQV